MLLFEVSGQCSEAHVCTDQLLLTFQEGKRGIQKHGDATSKKVKVEMKTEIQTFTCKYHIQLN